MHWLVDYVVLDDACCTLNGTEWRQMKCMNLCLESKSKKNGIVNNDRYKRNRPCMNIDKIRIIQVERMLEYRMQNQCNARNQRYISRKWYIDAKV